VRVVVHGRADVAVVVPVWDAYVRPLAEIALPSILAQGVNTSVWIVDNASAEPVPALLEPDAGTVPVRVVRSDRRLTAGAARNLALAGVRLTFPVVGALVRTRIARESGGFADADAGEDWLLGVRLAIRGRVWFADTVVRDYEPRRGSLSDAGGSIHRVVDRRRALRKALSEDGSLPRWVPRALPLIAVAHVVDIGLFRPMRNALKRLAGQTRREAAPGAADDAFRRGSACGRSRIGRGRRRRR
jgi:hypothetical protein